MGVVMVNDNIVGMLLLSDDVIPIRGHTDKVADAGTIEGWFIRGPIPGEWISRAAHLSGNHTLHVALAIQHVSGFQKSNKAIMLERFHFDRFGVKKDSVRRALERLQEAGLIKYTKVGQRYNVTIIQNLCEQE